MTITKCLQSHLGVTQHLQVTCDNLSVSPVRRWSPDQQQLLPGFGSTAVSAVEAAQTMAQKNCVSSTIYTVHSMYLRYLRFDTARVHAADASLHVEQIAV